MLGQAAKYAVARWIPGLLSFVAIATYTRLLSEDEYGRYALVLAWVTLLNAVGFEWLRAGVRRFFIAYYADRQAFLATVRGLFFGLCVAVAVAAVGAMVALEGTANGLILSGAGLLVAWGWSDLNFEMALAEVQTRRYAAALFMRAVVSLGLGCSLAIGGYGAVGVVLGVTSGFACSGLWMSRKQGSLLGSFLPRKDITRVVASYGIPLTLSAALVFVVNTSDRLLLGWLVGTAAVGPYAAAYDLIQMGVTVLVMPINLIAVPLAVQTIERNREGLDDHLRRTGTLLVGVALPVTAGVLALAPNLVAVALGAPFRDTALAVVPVIAGAAFLGALKTHYFDLAFVLTKTTRAQVLVSGTAAVVNVVANLFLIPIYGPLGAAWATLMALGCGMIMSARLGSQTLRLPLPLKAWAKSLFAAIVMVAALVPLREGRGLLTLVAQVSVGAGVYVLTAWMVDLDEIRQRLPKAWREFRTKI